MEIVKLSVEIKHAFTEISYSIGDGRPHVLEDIKGAAVPKDKIPEFMKFFISMKPPLYIFDGERYTITGIGKSEFKKIRDSLERVAPGKLVY